jgi:hypothetical protein
LLEYDGWATSGKEEVIFVGNLEEVESYCRKYDLLEETSKSI